MLRRLRCVQIFLKLSQKFQYRSETFCATVYLVSLTAVSVLCLCGGKGGRRSLGGMLYLLFMIATAVLFFSCYSIVYSRRPDSFILSPRPSRNVYK